VIERSAEASTVEIGEMESGIASHGSAGIHDFILFASFFQNKVENRIRPEIRSIPRSVVPHARDFRHDIPLRRSRSGPLSQSRPDDLAPLSESLRLHARLSTRHATMSSSERDDDPFGSLKLVLIWRKS